MKLACSNAMASATAPCWVRSVSVIAAKDLSGMLLTPSMSRMLLSLRADLHSATTVAPDGDKRRLQDEAARRAGFGSREEARRARTVVDRGVPELVEAKDDGLGVDRRRHVDEVEPKSMFAHAGHLTVVAV